MKKKHRPAEIHGTEALMYAAVGVDTLSGRHGGLMLIADADGMRAAVIRIDKDSKKGAAVSYTELKYDGMKECADRLVCDITPEEEDNMRITVVGEDAERLTESLRSALAYDEELACFDRRFESTPGTLGELILAGQYVTDAGIFRGHENEDIFLILLDRDGCETEIRLPDDEDTEGDIAENGFYCSGGVLRIRAGGERFTLDVPEDVCGFISACRSENGILLKNGSSRAVLRIPRCGAVNEGVS